ncbi:hypothetical protein [Chryseobacterium indoltheticum]|uniref:hypothetical protein n=1 Tax=Chryseobacterium indoltheticum TaxID=254 RepID=UPI003F491B8C
MQKKRANFKRLIEKAEAQVSRANERTKSSFSTKIRRTARKVEQAEEKNQRPFLWRNRLKPGMYM